MSFLATCYKKEEKLIIFIEFYCSIHVVEKTFTPPVCYRTTLLDASSYTGFVLKSVGMACLTIY